MLDKNEKMRLNKKAIAVESLVWIIVAVVILVVIIAGYVIITKKDISLIEFIKNLFRFRGK